ncbi:hypothetical protein N7467_012046 [Penicillium canescens]|nr:hypothetical protein N7467_012046 [Penicillium canescens]
MKHPPIVPPVGGVITAMLDSERSDRVVGAAFPPASVEPESRQNTGRRFNYTPMFASLHLPKAMTPEPESRQNTGRRLNYTPMFASLHLPKAMTPEPISSPSRDISGDKRPCRAFEITAAVQSPIDGNAVSQQARFQKQKDRKSGLVDLEAQRPNYSS